MNTDSTVAVRRVLLQLSIDYPDAVTCAEVLRRRLIALIASAGFTISSAATAAGLHHNLVVRKLASPARPASERRPLDEETIVRLLSAIARAPSALVECPFALGDEAVLQWLAEGRAAARRGGGWLSAAKHREPVADAVARWPDAAERIDRLARLGFVVVSEAASEDAARILDNGLRRARRVEDGATLSITPKGSACAVR